MKNSGLIASLCFVGLLFSGCIKDNDRITAEELLKDKDWFLERRKTDQNDHYFVGLPTFSFRLSGTSSYRDSDGISGAFAISRSDNSITLSISSTGRTITAYTVRSVGIRHLVLTYGSGASQSELYFSIRQ
jgi:hypothetical protein